MAISVVRTPKSEDPYSVHRIRYIDARPYRYRPRVSGSLKTQLSSLPRVPLPGRGGGLPRRRVCAVSVCHSACDTRNRDWRLPRLYAAYGYRGPPWTTYALCLPHSRLWLWTWASLGNSQQSAVLQAPLPLTSAQWHVKCGSGSAQMRSPPPPLPCTFITRVAPHCVNTLGILHAVSK